MKKFTEAFSDFFSASFFVWSLFNKFLADFSRRYNLNFWWGLVDMKGYIGLNPQLLAVV